MVSNIIGPERGRYRIQVVAAMTGVSAPTLRAWERRYQIPRPARTASSYRLYTDEDVEQVRQMRAICAAGHSPAEAARMVLQSSTTRVERARQDPWELLRSALLEATTAYDVQTIQALMLQLLHVGPASLAYEQVIAPVLHEVGKRWHEGSISVAQEHLLSHLMETTLRNMLQLVQAPDAPHTALLGCYSGEAHSLGLYGIGLRLAGWGYRVVVMSSGIPPDALAEAVKALKPNVVALSCMLDAPSEHHNDLTAQYAAACQGTPWIVGGMGSSNIKDAIEKHGGVHANGSLDGVRLQLDKLVRGR